MIRKPKQDAVKRRAEIAEQIDAAAAKYAHLRTGRSTDDICATFGETIRFRRDHVDTNVIVDLLEGDGRWYEWSREALTDARVEGSVVASAIVLGTGECATVSRNWLKCSRLRYRCTDLGQAAAHRAGLAHLAYRAAGGQREKLLGDFLIGAHAETLHATRPHPRSATLPFTIFPT